MTRNFSSMLLGGAVLCGGLAGCSKTPCEKVADLLPAASSFDDDRTYLRGVARSNSQTQDTCSAVQGSAEAVAAAPDKVFNRVSWALSMNRVRGVATSEAIRPQLDLAVQRLGNKLDAAADAAERGLERAVDGAGKAVDKAADNAGQAVEKAADAAGEALDKAAKELDK